MTTAAPRSVAVVARLLISLALALAVLFLGVEQGSHVLDALPGRGGGDRPHATGARLPKPPAGARSARVERVVDGDTVVLSGIGKARLIGVDTPEVYGRVECYGREASAFAKRVLAGRRVKVAWQVERTDRYGRALVDLWLGDGRFFNAMLVAGGYAQPLTIPPNVAHAQRFVALARQARQARRGLWGRGGCAERAEAFSVQRER